MALPAEPKELIDPLEDYVGRQLRRASFAIMGSLQDCFATIGLKSSEAVVLRYVVANPGCTQSEVSRALEVQRTNMVPIVSGLVKRGLLTRSRIDGRTQALRITPEGEALNRKVIAIGRQHEDHVFGSIPPKQLDMLRRIFVDIRERALDFRLSDAGNS